MTVRGLPALGEFMFAQCPADATTLSDCGNSSYAIADDTGAARVTIPVLQPFWSQRGRFYSCEEAGACAIVVTTTDDLATAQFVPIDFRDVGPIPVPVPTITVKPSTDLTDMQPVTIVTSGFVPFVSVLLLQCAAGWTSFQSECEQIDLAGEIDPEGNVTLQTNVHRTLQTSDGSTVSCDAPGACVISVLQYDTVVTVPISFAPTE